MSLYNNFIGIDIGKFNFVVAVHGKKATTEYANNSEGISCFMQDYKGLLAESLCILEATGGYEFSLLYALCSSNFTAHRANTRKVKNFIRSYGNGAKNDSLDAKALALYGFERVASLGIFVPQSAKLVQLYELVQRRNDLKQMLVAEKNRKQSPKLNIVKESVDVITTALSSQIAIITAQIDEMIAQDEALSERKKKLMSIPGIGNVVANELLALMPELGTLDRRKIASLAGLAPLAKDSGKFSGYRRVGHGRKFIKPMLFTAAMAARRSKSPLKDFYEKLIIKGKKKMVALTALMRKLLVIANAKLRAISNAGVQQAE